jgi:hypothetical protein
VGVDTCDTCQSERVAGIVTTGYGETACVAPNKRCQTRRLKSENIAKNLEAKTQFLCNLEVKCNCKYLVQALAFGPRTYKKKAKPKAA